MGIQAVKHLLPHEIKVEPFVRHDGEGHPSYGQAVFYRGRIEVKNRMIRDERGQERVARGRVFLATTDGISTNDKITLPSPYSPVNPTIMAVNHKEGRFGVDHLEVMFG